VAGAHSSNFKGTIVPWNSLGATPMTIRSRSLTRNVCPTASGAPRKPCLPVIVRNYDDGLSSGPLRLLRRINRPIAGFSPSAEKIIAGNSCPCVRSVCPSLLR